MNNFDTLPASVRDRFWTKVSQQENGCWLWTGKKDKNGGNFYLDGKFISVHRWLYTLIHGEIPKGYFVHRICNGKHCVNPDHLCIKTDPRGRTDEERFWEKVDKSGECWNWTAKQTSRETHNYGKFHLNGRRVLAHRYAYQLAYGEIPEGMVVRHSCDNPLCTRPDHLEIGTQAENVADMDKRGRRRVGVGERVCTAKLTEEDVKWIRKNYAYRDASSIGRQFGVSASTILAVVYRKTWKHIN